MIEPSPQQLTIERLAINQLGLGYTIVQGWRTRGQVAHRHRLALLEAAKRLRIKLDPADFDRFTVWYKRG